jgi:O-antigen ligase
MGASICWAAAETDAQSTIFDSSALKKQLQIFPACAGCKNGIRAEPRVAAPAGVSGALETAAFKPASALAGTVLLALAGLAACLALGAGPDKAFVLLIQGLVLLQAAHYLYLRRAPDAKLAWFLATPIAFWVCGALAPDAAYYKYPSRNLLAFIAIAAAVWMFPRRWRSEPAHGSLLAALVVALVSIVAQAIAAFGFARPFGWFENPHFISLQTLVTLCVAGYGLQRRDRLYRGLYRGLSAATLLGAAALAAWLPTRVGWYVAVLAAGAVGWFLLPRGKATWVALGVAAVTVLASLVVLDYNTAIEDPKTRQIVTDVVDDAGVAVRDERSVLWEDSWRLQLDSNVGNWWLGHGLGGFRRDFPPYSRFAGTILFDFPHNFFLEVLYNSGLVGLAVFAACLTALGIALTRALHRRRDPVQLLALALLVTVGAFCFLTLPLLSKYSAYALAYAVGFTLWTLDAAGPQP